MGKKWEDPRQSSTGLWRKREHEGLGGGLERRFVGREQGETEERGRYWSQATPLVLSQERALCPTLECGQWAVTALISPHYSTRASGQA